VRRVHTLACPRKGEPLAWVEVAPDGSRTVVVNSGAPGRDSLTTGRARIPESEFSDEEGSVTLSITAACSCGARWSVDLAAVLHGEPQTLMRDTSDFPGVSFDRRRHRGG
jgi:hypothetical protein